MARKRYRVTFEPLARDAKLFLSASTGINFNHVDFTKQHEWFCCTVYSGAVPVIVIVFEFKSEFDAYFTLAISDPAGLSRQLITTLYRAVFSHAARVTALVDPDNAVAMRQVWRMGFRQEGYMRRGYDGVRDATMWGLLPEDCPYMHGLPFHFQVVQQTHEAAQGLQ